MKKHLVGGILVLALCFLTIPSHHALADTYSWTTQAGAGLEVWFNIASSADGSKIAAVGALGNAVDLGTDSGSGFAWTNTITGSTYSITSIASSADGMRLAGVGGLTSGATDYLYTGINSGSGFVWTSQTSLGLHKWVTVASSADGRKIIAADYGGYVYTGKDSGSGFVWTTQASLGANNWDSVTSSADGTKVVVANNGGPMYVGIDSGSGFVWTPQSSSYLHVRISADGTKIVGTDGYDIFTGVSSGSTFIWTPRGRPATMANLGPFVMSSDGTTLATADNIIGYIYTAPNASGTLAWTRELSVGNPTWIGLALSANGSKIVAASRSVCGVAAVCGSTGYIYTGIRNTVPTVLTTSVSGVTATTAILKGQLTSMGGATTTNVGFGYDYSGGYTIPVSAGALTSQGYFTATIGSLFCNTKYTFRATASNSVGSVVAPTGLSFVTLLTLPCSGTAGGGVKTTDVTNNASSMAASGVTTASLGSSGANVEIIQNILIANGYLNTTASGYFGLQTQAAVMAFQKDKGLSVVGNVGPKTAAALTSLGQQIISAFKVNTNNQIQTPVNQNQIPTSQVQPQVPASQTQIPASKLTPSSMPASTPARSR